MAGCDKRQGNLDEFLNTIAEHEEILKSTVERNFDKYHEQLTSMKDDLLRQINNHTSFYREELSAFQGRLAALHKESAARRLNIKNRHFYKLLNDYTSNIPVQEIANLYQSFMDANIIERVMPSLLDRLEEVKESLFGLDSLVKKMLDLEEIHTKEKIKDINKGLALLDARRFMSFTRGNNVIEIKLEPLSQNNIRQDKDDEEVFENGDIIFHFDKYPKVKAALGMSFHDILSTLDYLLEELGGAREIIFCTDSAVIENERDDMLMILNYPLKDMARSAKKLAVEVLPYVKQDSLVQTDLVVSFLPNCCDNIGKICLKLRPIEFSDDLMSQFLMGIFSIHENILWLQLILKHPEDKGRDSTLEALRIIGDLLQDQEIFLNFIEPRPKGFALQLSGDKDSFETAKIKFTISLECSEFVADDQNLAKLLKILAEGITPNYHFQEIKRKYCFRKNAKAILSQIEKTHIFKSRKTKS